MLGIPKRKARGKKRDRKGVLGTEILSQVDVTYKSSDSTMLSDAQSDALLASTEYKGDADDALGVDSGEHYDKPVEEDAWDFHD